MASFARLAIAAYAQAVRRLRKTDHPRRITRSGHGRLGVGAVAFLGLFLMVDGLQVGVFELVERTASRRPGESSALYLPQW